MLYFLKAEICQYHSACAVHLYSTSPRERDRCMFCSYTCNKSNEGVLLPTLQYQDPHIPSHRQLQMPVQYLVFSYSKVFCLPPSVPAGLHAMRQKRKTKGVFLLVEDYPVVSSLCRWTLGCSNGHMPRQQQEKWRSGCEVFDNQCMSDARSRGSDGCVAD